MGLNFLASISSCASAVQVASNVANWCGFRALRMVYWPAGKSCSTNLGRVCRYGFLMSILRLLRQVPSMIIKRIWFKWFKTAAFNSGDGTIPSESSSVVVGYSNIESLVDKVFFNIASSNTSPDINLLFGKHRCNKRAVPFVSSTSSGCCSIKTSTSLWTFDIKWQMQVVFGRKHWVQLWRFKLTGTQEFKA